MSKTARAIVIGITAILLAGIAGIAISTNTKEGCYVMDEERIIPPIDASAPAVTETATFALG